MIIYDHDGTFYLLIDEDTQEVLDHMEEVAILYDGNVMLKHGHPDRIEPLFTQYRTAYSKGAIDTNTLGALKGKIPLDELNKIINTSGYIGVYLRRLKDDVWG